ncbi:alveolar macrophage chemotactic factor [Hippoglossus hippoglossus]|uniref:alveolar macrophage chemotactic factor n=1 Tax=Hippoglossus hippoglossus TaxID=8267 RepID=UPI00148D905B|nr:alveolar macrophage chemotactic factor [Hippoglossus hippoglossus]
MMMLQKPLLLLAALTLCCCITSLHAFRRRGCHCIRTTTEEVPAKCIKKIEVFAVSGQCRRTEILITRKNGYKVCVDPEVDWVLSLLQKLQR